MTKSQRRKTKLEGRPEWVSSGKTCEECGAPLVFTRQTTYICTACGLIQEHIKNKKQRRGEQKNARDEPSGPHICLKCGNEFSSWDVMNLHWFYTGHAKPVLKCPKCNQKFGHPTMLAQHQKKMGH
jgi:DNA-directed RNA polymerase subunit RPC12/RpoP